MEIVWSPRAHEWIRTIGDYIAQDSPATARKFLDRLIQSVARLRKFPFSGQVTPENTAYRHVVTERYRIIYRVTEKQIQIITVIPPRKEADKLLKTKPTDERP